MNKEHEELRHTVPFTLEELKDIETNLNQCKSEGYISFGDPAYSAYDRILEYLELLEV